MKKLIDFVKEKVKSKTGVNLRFRNYFSGIMKKKILIFAGGFSKEREISLKTAKGVFNEIKKKYITKICEPDGNLIKNLRHLNQM